jgi:hypothetical protein
LAYLTKAFASELRKRVVRYIRVRGSAAPYEQNTQVSNWHGAILGSVSCMSALRDKPDGARTLLRRLLMTLSGRTKKQLIFSTLGRGLINAQPQPY